jgi:hypothetical protein
MCLNGDSSCREGCYAPVTNIDPTPLNQALLCHWESHVGEHSEIYLMYTPDCSRYMAIDAGRDDISTQWLSRWLQNYGCCANQRSTLCTLALPRTATQDSASTPNGVLFQWNSVPFNKVEAVNV